MVVAGVKIFCSQPLAPIFCWLSAFVAPHCVEYNNSGFQDYLNGRLDSAEKKYKRAIELYPDYTEAHYNLGLLYEDLQNLERARTEYGLAVQSGFPRRITTWHVCIFWRGNTPMQ
jgi:TolA-binding protein